MKRLWSGGAKNVTTSYVAQIVPFQVRCITYIYIVNVYDPQNDKYYHTVQGNIIVIYMMKFGILLLPLDTSYHDSLHDPAIIQE